MKRASMPPAPLVYGDGIYLCVREPGTAGLDGVHRIDVATPEERATIREHESARNIAPIVGLYRALEARAAARASALEGMSFPEACARLGLDLPPPSLPRSLAPPTRVHGAPRPVSLGEVFMGRAALPDRSGPPSSAAPLSIDLSGLADPSAPTLPDRPPPPSSPRTLASAPSCMAVDACPTCGAPYMRRP